MQEFALAAQGLDAVGPVEALGLDLPVTKG